MKEREQIYDFVGDVQKLIQRYPEEASYEPGQIL